MKKKKLKYLFITAICASLAGCTNPDYYPIEDGAKDTSRREGVEGLGYEKVLILYLEGYNNLKGDLEGNLEQLEEGFIPARNDKQAIVVYSHSSKTGSDYTTPTEPVIYHLYKHYGQTVRDTIKRYSAEQIMLRTDMVKDVLGTIKTAFPSYSYGLLFSSHASGWLPSGYKYGSGDISPMTAPSSVGAQFWRTSSFYYSLNADEFAEALPMHLEYIIFDCCLMGGVETNYDLKDKTDYIVAAPTEVMSYGFNYTTMASRLLQSDKADLKGVCDDFYDKLESSYLTVALYDCSAMDALASVCRKIFDAHPDNEVFEVQKAKVQSYNYSFNYHYDFRDIIEKMGASESELKALDGALEKVVLYKLATDTFIYTPINADTFSGMSMYLPQTDWPTLNSFYKKTSWDIATGLLK